MGLPALVLLLVAGLAAVGAVATQVRCLDAARDGALAASRGESGAEAARRMAPEGATVSVVVEGERVRATVRASVRPLSSLLPRLTVSAEAVAAVEPGSPEPVP